MRLDGKKALVTGRSKGIGRGIAVAFAQAGADVVTNYNSDPRGAQELVAEVEALGGLDALVNNAGIERHAALTR